MTRPHVLILTGPMGSGHLRAAQALRDTFLERFPGVDVTLVDTVGWMSPVIRWIFLDFYSFLLRHCAFVWRWIHAAQNNSGSGLFPLLFRLFSGPMDRNLLDYAKRHHPDFILSAHFYPGFMTARLKRKKLLDVPSAVVVTDYAGHRIYVQPEHEFIFVANSETREQFVKWGAEADRIRIAGIPVLPKYAHLPGKEEVRQYARELHLKPYTLYVMVTMGGWAIDDMEPLIRKLMALESRIGVIAMTGINRLLLEKLSPLAAEYDQLKIIPFTSSMEKYLAVSTFVITKPGGITTSECIAFRKPMLLVDPIAGHEECNLKILEKFGIALAQHPEEGIDEALIRLFHHRFALRRRLQELSPAAAGASQAIVSEIIGFMEKQTAK